MKANRLGLALLALFVLSGFAGLVYQSVWSHYLGLVLGHAAYAQTLVLAIFMGGMAAGAWYVSRRSLHWRRLILAYAMVELAIGVLGLAFQPLFQAYTDFSQQTVLPALGNPLLAHAWQWASAALLILPQSLLLGATFPLMSSGYLRAVPDQDGKILGGLYFSNSLGAALGALVSTFVLLGAVGLPGTVMTAGLLNVVVALGAWAVSKWVEGGEAPAPVAEQAPQAGGDNAEVRRLGKLMVLATGISGAASFVYEIGWVRLLNQALGTTVHSFELMLAAFILGLAFGGLWIRKRGAAIAMPVRYVGYVQVLMGVAALLSVPVFAQSFRWVGWMMGALSRNDGGYTLFQLGTAAIALLVMFPAAFFAGMTLPLFTLALLRAGAGERAIGRIYAANTLGAIAGVAAMVHVLVPLLGVKLAVTLAALIDAALGLYLLRMVDPGLWSRGAVSAAAATVLGLATSLIGGRVDPVEQASGVFRTGRARLAGEGVTVPYLRDGKTATVAIYSTPAPRHMGIATNGKPDAGLTPLPERPTSDEVTMMMAGLMTLAAHPKAQDIALIGWGSGLSTHTVLGSPVPRSVDTVEIEPAMHQGARLFGDRVARAYDDPRSHVRFEDARTFFATGARQYDAILSEPSNPWVSGVASLFTEEFYGFLRGHLKPGGVLVQWIHTYELDDKLVATMMAALVKRFPESDVYVTNDADLLIVAYRDRRVPFNADAWSNPVLAAELRRVGLAGLQELELRRIGSAQVLRAFDRLNRAVAHSDYFPVVSLRAPKTRFQGLRSNSLQELVTNGMPVLDVLECRKPLDADAGVALHNPDSIFSEWRETALLTRASIEQGRATDELVRLSSGNAADVDHALVVARRLPADDAGMKAWSSAVASLASATLGHLAPQDLQRIWVEPTWLPDAVRTHSDAGRLLDAYAAAAERNPVKMRGAAEKALALPASRLSPLAREEMLVLAMLGAMGSGDAAGAAELERRLGRDIAPGPFAGIRSYLLAWIDEGAPACMASTALQ